MEKFEMTECRFKVDGKEELLLCGEIHYFRMDRQYWEKALDALVEAGCNAVAYYVPWFVHEYEQGKFDFDGSIHPSNDLHEWIRLTKKKGLMGFLRPGPYVYAETTDLGIPQWFTRQYPDAQVKRYENGAYINSSTIHCAAHNNPDFLREVSLWYEHLCAEIRQYLAPQGNVVMVQLCNEIPCDDHNDENPVNLGIGREDGLYPSYLKQKYGTVENLNARYGISAAPLTTVEPYMLMQADAEKAQAERLEYYYTWYYPRYFQTLHEMMQKNGVDTCFVHNAYNPRAVSLHYHNKKKNPWLHIGVDCYYSLNGRPTIHEGVYYCEYGAEYIRRFLQNVPWIMEQECGYWNDYPQVYGPELYIWNVYAMAAGYRGINMYLFASGINRPGMGFFGTDHNWQAPVDAYGEKRETFADIARSISDIKANRDVFMADLRYDLAFGIKNDPGLIWTQTAKPTDELFYSLKAAGFTPQICDFAAASPEELRRHPALVVSGDLHMDQEVQEKLLNYALDGGKLVLGGRMPVLDSQGRPCTVLADALSIAAEATPFADQEQEKLIFGGVEYFVGKRMQVLQTAKENCIAWNQAGQPAAVKCTVGSGCVLVLPYTMEVKFFSQTEALRILLEQAGISASIHGMRMLRVLPKKTGDSVILNLHPVEIREKLDIYGRCVDAVLAPFSFMIFEKEGHDEQRAV